jgi:bifunctional DNA-binding transcriptional regulator/antitoxin component of YhaV-PrlF toxin-antitoxin module
MLNYTIRITEKGQITIPHKIHNIIDSDTITFSVTNDNKILISPVHDIAGSLTNYSNTEINNSIEK